LIDVFIYYNSNHQPLTGW